MKASSDKCHFLASGKDKENLSIEKTKIENSKCQKLLG